MTAYSLEGTIGGLTPKWFGNEPTIAGTFTLEGAVITDIRMEIPLFDPFTDLHSPPAEPGIIVYNDNGYLLIFSIRGLGLEPYTATEGRLINSNPDPNQALATNITLHISCDPCPVPAPEVGTGPALALALLGVILYRRARA
jgi:hypothetical protein